MTMPKECSCEQGLDAHCPVHGRAAEVNRATRNHVASWIGALVASVLIYQAGKYVQRAESAPKTVAVCESSDALEGLSWKVDLTQPLEDQGCKVHEAFPGSVLCEREVTVECEVPR